MSEALKDLSDMIENRIGDAFAKSEITFDALTIHVSKDSIVDVVKELRDNHALQFTTLVDICAVDYPDREQRFEVVYHFLSMQQNQRVRIKIGVREDAVVDSINDLHPSANWFEREVFDMNGVMFAGHPDLRRILTDYGFRGHPLRKDFPTTGYTEVRYDEEQKRVVYEPVSLVQEYRQFDFMSPWEGAEYILPEDETTKGEGA